MAKRTKALPRTLGACADRLYDLRAERTVLMSKVRELEEEEKRVKEHLIQELPKSEAGGIKGRRARAEIVRRLTVHVTDWEMLHKHLLKTKDFSILQRRVNEAAVKERWEDAKKVPGTEPFHYLKVSVTKA